MKKSIIKSIKNFNMHTCIIIFYSKDYLHLKCVVLLLYISFILFHFILFCMLFHKYAAVFIQHAAATKEI